MVTHDRAIAAQADRIVRLAEGQDRSSVEIGESSKSGDCQIGRLLEILGDRVPFDPLLP